MTFVIATKPLMNLLLFHRAIKLSFDSTSFRPGINFLKSSDLSRGYSPFTIINAIRKLLKLNLALYNTSLLHLKILLFYILFFLDFKNIQNTFQY